MASDEEKLIYTQRYETFRHFDSLRWQIPTWSLTGAGVLLGIATPDTETLPPWWAFLVVSSLLLLSAYAVQRIRAGIHVNNEVLKRYSTILGDSDIPEPNTGFEPFRPAPIIEYTLPVTIQSDEEKLCGQ